MHQKQGMWKDKIAPENTQSAVSFCGRDRRIWPPNWTRERNRPKISKSAVSFCGQAADHNRRIHPENRGENGGLIRRFHSAVRNRRVNRRTQPEIINASGVKRRLQIGGQTADLTAESDQRPLVQNGGFIRRPWPPIKPQIHQKWWIQGESQGNHQERSSRKTKLTYVQARTFPNINGTRITIHKHTTRYNTQRCMCESDMWREYTHITYAKWVCATKSLQWKTKHKKYTFGVLVTLRPWGH